MKGKGVKPARERIGQKQSPSSARRRHIEKPALFLERGGVLKRTLVRKRTLRKPHHEHRIPFKPFSLMDRREHHSITFLLALFTHGAIIVFERHFRKKARYVRILFGKKSKLLQIFQTIVVIRILTFEIILIVGHDNTANDRRGKHFGKKRPYYFLHTAPTGKPALGNRFHTKSFCQRRRIFNGIINVPCRHKPDARLVTQHAHPRHLVANVGKEAKIGDEILDMSALKKSQTAAILVGNVALGKFEFKLLGME